MCPRGVRPLRILALAGLAAVVCGVSLTLVFPGYLDPFAVYHTDHFEWVGMADREGGAVWRYLDAYARPVSFMLLHQCGRLGIHFLLMPVFIACLLNAALLAHYIERITGRSVGFVSFGLFVAVSCAHPAFYWMKSDPLGIFALTFLLAIAHCWQSYAETGGWHFFAGTLLLVVVLSQTKESYFVVLVLFGILQVAALPQRRRAAVAFLLVSLGAMAFSLYWTTHIWPMFGDATRPGDPYYKAFTPGSVTRSWIRLASHLFLPGILVALPAALLLAWSRDRAAFWVAAAGPIGAIAALVPNATLPNHLDAHFAGLGIYFACLPFLMAASLIPPRTAWRLGSAGVAVALYGSLVLAYNRPSEIYTVWLRDQEVIARHLVRSLEAMKARAGPNDSTLVAGLTAPFNPFRVPNFIAKQMGPGRRWTVVVADDIRESSEQTTRLVHASSPTLRERYDHLFAMRADGSLEADVEGPAIARALARLGVPPPEERQTPGNRLYAVPNPAPPDSRGLAKTRIFWASESTTIVEVRVGAPSGPVFATGAATGSSETGAWVRNGTAFFLQDGSRGDPTAPEHTLAILRVVVEAPHLPGPVP
jgi:hypothetical protein